MRAFVVVCLLFAATATARAEGQDVVLGRAESFHSAALGEERTVNVYLPPGYDASAQYPVIYLLDGAVDEDYHHVSGLVQFLTAYALMPPSILVGVANVDRYRDFTFPTEIPELLERIPNAGNSANFVRYLGEELMPWIESRYPTDGISTVIGQSLGGLLVAEIFLRWPDYFDNYMIVSPSFWWDDGSLLDAAPELLSGRRPDGGMLYLALGDEGEEMQVAVDRFVGLLEEQAPPSLRWWYVPFPDETHATILHRALYRGFEHFYGEEYPGL